jgi:hypothetical protein
MNSRASARVLFIFQLVPMTSLFLMSETTLD